MAAVASRPGRPSAEASCYRWLNIGMRSSSEGPR